MSSRYFVSPTIDLMFVCGGAVLFFAGCNWAAQALGAQHQLAFFNNLAIIAALFLGETHTTATIVGLGQDRDWSSGLTRRTVWAAIMSLLLVVLLLFNAALPPLAVRLYLISVSWHFTRQAYGIMLLYCRKSNFKPRSYQKWLWQALLQLTMLNWILVQLSNYFGLREETFLLQKIPSISLLPPALVDVAAWLIALLALVTAVDLIYSLVRRPADAPPLLSYIMLFSIVLFFLPCGVNEALRQSVWLYAPAMFHGSGYLCVLADRFRAAYSGQNGGLSLYLTSLYGRCLVLALCFFIASPWLLHLALGGLGVTYGTALVAVFVPVQVFHMAMDMVMWRRSAKGKVALRPECLQLTVGHTRGAVVH